MEGEEMKFILKHCEYVCAIFISIIVATLAWDTLEAKIIFLGELLSFNLCLRL